MPGPTGSVALAGGRFIFSWTSRRAARSGSTGPTACGRSSASGRSTTWIRGCSKSRNTAFWSARRAGASPTPGTHNIWHPLRLSLGTWIFCGDESRRRRGCDVAIPRRRAAATPRPRREYSVEASRGDVAAATHFATLRDADIPCGGDSRRRRGRDEDIPRRRIAAPRWTPECKETTVHTRLLRPHPPSSSSSIIQSSSSSLIVSSPPADFRTAFASAFASRSSRRRISGRRAPGRSSSVSTPS